MALELVVVTPSGEALSEEVEQGVLPGEAGEFGVLESHERFLTPLAFGPMQIISSEGTRWGALSSGFAEVDGSRVVVLVDSWGWAPHIHREVSESRRVEVDAELAALADGDENDGERSRLEAALAQAELEVDVAGR
jgi:F-type H+-transporting ATPase subunit epsilon